MDLKSKRLLKEVSISLRILAESVFVKLQNTPVSFKITSGLRSEEEQMELFLKGNSPCDGVKYKSKHQSGNAIDFMASYEGKDTFDDIEYYYYIARNFEIEALNFGFNIKWGGWFKKKNGQRFIDGMHIELA